MLEITLFIQTPQRHFSVYLTDKLSVGRTNLADIVIDDAGLSKIHATFKRHDRESGAVADGEVWIYDEDSLNGTFVNGEQVLSGGARRLANGDEILVGSNTLIGVQIRARASDFQSSELRAPAPKAAINKSRQQVPLVLIFAGGATLLILASMIIGILAVRSFENDGEKSKNSKARIQQSADIPVAVIDPLKGDPDDLDDIFEAFEIQEDMNAENLDDVKSVVKETVDSANPENMVSLNVTRAFWEEAKAKSLVPRAAATGISPPGLEVPPELRGDGVIKQKQKLAELINVLHYQQPMDFGDLAQKRLNKELIELPMATNSFYLEVGSNASAEDFTAFDFDNGNTSLASDSPKMRALKQLAANFSGQVYDLNNGRDRQQMRIRLLRMFHPRALPILKELGDAYLKKFNRPLRVTSLTRSMDYQISLNKTNPNSFKVKGAGSLPPHTSGCAFDLGRKHMTAEEQNFVMQKLAEMENRGVLDALIEFNANACFHTFIYPDGKPPRQ